MLAPVQHVHTMLCSSLSVKSYHNVLTDSLLGWIWRWGTRRKLGEKVSEKNFILSRDGALKSTEQGRDEKLNNTTLLLNNVSLLSGLQRNTLAFLVRFVVWVTKWTRNVSLLSGLQCNALAFLVHFVVWVTKWTRNASALRWRPERRLTLFRSRVVFWSFSSLPCFCTFYSSIPTQNEVFFRNLFPLV